MKEETFLLALDITEDTTTILDTAEKLANNCGAKLLTLTVVQPIAAVYGSLYTVPYAISSADFEQEALRSAHEKLQVLSANHGVAKEDVHTRLGLPAPDIRAAVADLDCDLLIMGTHARSGIGRILGSTASAVLHGLQCDVYLVNLRNE